ncbi:hypothetical protein DID88_001290 [Monilinia fructigena]|uniref:Uncharacterized protein n=1 Tax=Monilinia fructigena TaxID=38457 RepID=A0A395IZ96_9HELO|nr:hypothetical protein DID88_001290 [Monilinia fructigena]
MFQEFGFDLEESKGGYWIGLWTKVEGFSVPRILTRNVERTKADAVAPEDVAGAEGRPNLVADPLALDAEAPLPVANALG